MYNSTQAVYEPQLANYGPKPRTNIYSKRVSPQMENFTAHAMKHMNQSKTN